MATGQRVVHTATTAVGGLTHDKEYFVYVVDNDTIKQCGSKFQTQQSRPVFVEIRSGGAGT